MLRIWAYSCLWFFTYIWNIISIHHKDSMLIILPLVFPVCLLCLPVAFTFNLQWQPQKTFFFTMFYSIKYIKHNFNYHLFSNNYQIILNHNRLISFWRFLVYVWNIRHSDEWTAASLKSMYSKPNTISNQISSILGLKVSPPNYDSKQLQ